MTPRELLERIEGLGLVEPKVLGQIRRHIEDPGKKVRPKAIVSFLLKKELISKSQAAGLLNAIDAPKAIQHEELEVSASPEKAYDTDDLTSTAREVVAEVAHKSDPQRTIDAVAVEDDDEAEAVDLIEVERPKSAKPKNAKRRPAPEPHPLDAPLGDDFGADYEATMYGQQSTKEEKSKLGFRGKRLKKDQWATKWLYIGSAILGSLLIFGAVLYYAVNWVSAEDQFKAAITSFENGSYSDAIKKFDEFIEDYPNHEKTNTVKVRRVQSLIAQTYEDKNWDETISRAKNWLQKLLEDPTEPNLDVIRDDIALMLPNAALQISERAIKQTEIAGMKEQLAKAQDAKMVIEDASFIPTSKRKSPNVAAVYDKFNDNILSVQGLIQKENDYAKALLEIESLTDQSKTDEAFSLYHQLTRRYAELATREELQVAMKAVSTKERALVKPVSVEIAVATDARPSEFTASIVLASKNGTKLDANRDIVTPILAEGSLYGIDTSDGSVVWRKWLGFESIIPPQMFNADWILVCDRKNHDLLMIKLLDGSVIWRSQIGEPFLQPAFNEAMIILTASSGKVMKLDPRSGEVVTAVQLPQAANVSALIAEREPYIYQPGSYSNLYVLSAEDLVCRDVYYLGHQNGSIEFPPQNWVGHILVAVNGGNRCDLHVLKPAEQELGLQLVQILNRITAAPVKTPLIRFGRWMLVASDNGDLKILQLNPDPEDSVPITQFAEEKFEKTTGEPAFLLAEGSQLWIAGKGIMKYRVQGSLGKFNRQSIENATDSFIAPLSKVEEVLIHTRRRDRSGMVSVSAVDSETLKQIWRTDLGGPVAGAPSMVDGKIQAVSNQGDVFMVDEASESKGVADNAVKSSTIIESLMFSNSVNLGDNKFAVWGPQGRDDLLYVEDGQSRLVKIQSPANQVAAQPIAVGGDLIVPSKQGQVVRIDARTGQMVGAPFQPPVRPGVDVDWKDPIAVGDSLIAIVKGADEGSPSAVLLLDGSDTRSLKRVAGIESDSKVKSGLAVVDNTLFVVVGEKEGDQLVSLDANNGLASIGSANLPANWIAGPWSVNGKILVRLDSDELVCFDGQLNSLWKVSLPNDQFAGDPIFMDSNIAITLRKGTFLWLDENTGAIANSVDLGEPVINVLQDGDRMLFGGMDGTVHIWQTN